MGVIDMRQPVRYREICEHLLAVAENPLNFIQQPQHEISPGIRTVPNAAKLARQASASVISNCVAELWSVSVACLHAIEPIFPFYPSNVIKFVDETRLPFLSYVSIYYNLCKTNFNGTATQQKMKILLDMRHSLQHDKPDVSADFHKERTEKVLKWKKTLEPFVGKEGLLWLPRIRDGERRSDFRLGGEPPIMKFMKYPVAKWAYDCTSEMTEEMKKMLFTLAPGSVKLEPNDAVEDGIDPRITPDPDLLRLWAAGE